MGEFIVLNLETKRFRIFGYKLDAMEYAEELAKTDGWSWDSDWIPKWIQIIPISESDIFYMDQFKESFIEEE